MPVLEVDRGIPPSRGSVGDRDQALCPSLPWKTLKDLRGGYGCETWGTREGLLAEAGGILREKEGERGHPEREGMVWAFADVGPGGHCLGDEVVA